MRARHSGIRVVRYVVVLFAALLLLGLAASSAGADGAKPSPDASQVNWSPSLAALAATQSEARAAARPYINRLSAASGKPGARVTITGRNFGKRRGKGKVTFGAFKSVKYVRWSAKRIICKVPVIPFGKLTLKVHTAKRASNGKRFTVKRLPTVVPKTTEVLTNATLAGASTTDSSTFHFTNTSETSGVAPGDVLVGQPTESLPEGVFGKVTSVTDGVQG